MQSHSNTTYIDLSTEKLIGTGPFIYDYYKKDIEVRFHRFNRYWRTNPYFEILIFEILDESESRCQAMLRHSVDMIFGYDPCGICDLENDPLTTFVETGPDLIYWYKAFNTFRVNVTWREAISKAINYTYIIKGIRNGNAVRGPPAVPSGMPGHDPTVVVAKYNIPEARTVIQSMGFGYTGAVSWDVGTQVGDVFTPGANESLWLSATFFTDAFGHELTLNLFSGSSFNRDLNDLLYFDLNRIGIDIVERAWSPFGDPWGWGSDLTLEEHLSFCDMWYSGWGPDFIDAFTMLDPLFNKNSASNYIQLNDSIVQGWLEAAAVETNITNRYELFSKLQHRLFEVLYAHIPLFANLGRVVHGIDIKGYPYNQLGSFLAWPIYRESA
jgi:ABC-type transport system substrate-binding protein